MKAHVRNSKPIGVYPCSHANAIRQGSVQVGGNL